MKWWVHTEIFEWKNSVAEDSFIYQVDRMVMHVLLEKDLFRSEQHMFHSIAWTAAPAVDIVFCVPECVEIFSKLKS